MLRLLAILVVAGGFIMALNVPSASAIDTDWEGNGASGGTCDDIGEFDDLDPGPGQQGWLFILTSPEGDDWTLNATFSDGAQSVEGEQQGTNGSIHFIVYTEAGATLESATATNGTANSILTVSHCELGETEETQTLTVTKQCVGTTEGQFDLLVDGSIHGSGENVGCGEGTGAVEVDADTYTVSENIDSGGPFTTTTFGGDCNPSTGVVTVAEGEDAACTVINTLEGEVPDTTLTVVKDCGDFVGTGPTFTFLIDGSPVDGLTATCDSISETVSIDPGVDFDLAEDLDLPEGWSFDSASCDAGGPEAIDGGVELNADEGADITCTFVNTFATAGVAGVASPTPTSTTVTGAAALTPTPTATTPAAVSQVQGAIATPVPTATGEAEVSAVSEVAPISEVGGVHRPPSTGSGGLLDREGSAPWLILGSAMILGALAGATLLLGRARR
jgi:hypothetical protein